MKTEYIDHLQCVEFFLMLFRTQQTLYPLILPVELSLTMRIHRYYEGKGVGAEGRRTKTSEEVL